MCLCKGVHRTLIIVGKIKLKLEESKVHFVLYYLTFDKNNLHKFPFLDICLRKKIH